MSLFIDIIVLLYAVSIFSTISFISNIVKTIEITYIIILRIIKSVILSFILYILLFRYLNIISATNVLSEYVFLSFIIFVSSIKLNLIFSTRLSVKRYISILLAKDISYKNNMKKTFKEISVTSRRE